MLFIVTILIALTMILLAPRLRMGGHPRLAPHGSVSERWLAEYRASQGA